MFNIFNTSLASIFVGSEQLQAVGLLHFAAPPELHPWEIQGMMYFYDYCRIWAISIIFDMETRPNIGCTTVEIVGGEGGNLVWRVMDEVFMTCSVVLPNYSMAAQNALLVHFMPWNTACCHWDEFLLCSLRFCQAEIVSLMAACCISLFLLQTCKKWSWIFNHPDVTFCMYFLKLFALQL